jgi:hypothetical protein
MISRLTYESFLPSLVFQCEGYEYNQRHIRRIILCLHPFYGRDKKGNRNEVR